ncbi:hypothetical protein GOV14_04985 [Candidatus Pacearchaeota archaeon]|nr:hypothetical protein [Candidatus Pacearchaeota archaeon]
MELPKFFVAIGITFMLVAFFSSVLSTFYKAPKLDYSDCYGLTSSSSSCSSMISKTCTGNDEYFACSSDVRNSDAYKTCVTESQSSQTSCMAEQAKKLQTYQIIYYLLSALIGIALIVGGFYILDKKTIGTGLIGAGTITLLFGSFVASISALTSSLTSGLTSLNLGGTTKIPFISYLNIIFLLIGAVLLILLAYFKLDRVEKKLPVLK